MSVPLTRQPMREASPCRPWACFPASLHRSELAASRLSRMDMPDCAYRTPSCQCQKAPPHLLIIDRPLQRSAGKTCRSANCLCSCPLMIGIRDRPCSIARQVQFPRTLPILSAAARTDTVASFWQKPWQLETSRATSAPRKNAPPVRSQRVMPKKVRAYKHRGGGCPEEIRTIPTRAFV